jgi:hypothetical protein
MRQRQAQIRDTLVRVQRFLDENAAALGGVNSSGARRALDDAAARLTEHSVAQREHIIGATGETRKQRVLRLALRNRHLRPIANVAAASLAGVPEIAALRLPSKDLRGSRLVTAADAMANAAAPYLATFTGAGLKPDFLDALRALTREFEASHGERSDHVIARRASTIGLGVETAGGRAALHLLDAAIQQQLPNDAQLLAEWKGVRRISRSGA